MGGILLIANLSNPPPPTAVHDNTIVNTFKTNTVVKKIEDLASNYSFAAQENPKFNFPSVAYASDLNTKTAIYDASGRKMNANVDVSSKGQGSLVSIPNSQQFKPGKYKLVIDQNGRKIEQDFMWGVLAINPDKSIYSPGEKAHLALAVLDEKGKMVCDVPIITLTITNPLGKVTNFSNQNGTIKQNDECRLKEFTTKPDYETSYTVGGIGAYKMNLKAQTANGNYEISDFFTVQGNPDYDVQREGPTRIFPQRVYPMAFNIIANKDFTGSIRESVPSFFKITPLKDAKENTRLEKNGNIQYLVWDISMKKGEQIRLGYEFKAPPISPEFYLLGPLSFFNGSNPVFKEGRSWQIASDAVISFVQEVGVGNGSVSQNTLVIDVTVTTTVGNFIIVSCAHGNSGPAISAIDSKDSTGWQVDATSAVADPAKSSLLSRKIAIALVSGDTITVTTSGATFSACSAQEWSGLDTTTWFDKSSSNNNSVSSTPYDSNATATTSQADELLYGVIAHNSTSTIIPDVQSPVWDERTNAASTGTVRTVHPVSRVVSSTGAYNNSGSLGTARGWSAIIGTYKASTGGGGGGGGGDFLFEGVQLQGLQLN
jgi:hypothetical protein